jgi:hypothetical protein
VDGVERGDERGATLVPAGGAVAGVERGVDRSGRRFRSVARDDEDDPEVLRKVERRERRAVAGAELRTVDEE